MAQLIFAGAWHDIEMLGRWTYPHLPELCGGLPRAWLIATAPAPQHHTCTPAAMLLDATEEVIEVVRSCASVALSAELDADKQENSQDESLSVHHRASEACSELAKAHACSQHSPQHARGLLASCCSCA